MPELLLSNVPDELIRELKIRAARNNRSVEAEHLAILEQILGGGTDTFRVRAARWRKRLEGTDLEDSTDAIRRGRDGRMW